MREEHRSDERGFTLLELLVAVTIISILLAISAQSYYQQRRKGWMAQTKSSVRNMATAENTHVYAGGALAFTSDLDDLWFQGYRYSTDSVIPHVALATSQNYCVQVNSAHDPSIVWHFSSEVGYPQEGPATASACGDIEGVGSYRTSGTGARDGVSSSGVPVARPDPGVGGDASPPEIGDSSSTGGGDTAVGSTPTTTDPGGASAGRDGDGDDGGSSSGGTDEYDGTTDTTGGSTSTGDDPGDSSGDDGSSGGNGNGNGNNDGPCKNGSDPDGDANGGEDKPGGSGGTDQSDQDCNNGSGNDADGEDDNKGGGKKK